ncbi:MAG TPA: hypothetical protein VIV12_23395 [Streptosporangiaceae bacterium]
MTRITNSGHATSPAAGRSDLLQLLFQVLKTEPCGWTGLGGPDADGHWTVMLDRGVRLFRGVTDLDDYWSRRHKSWERDPAEPEASPGEPRHGTLRAPALATG